MINWAILYTAINDGKQFVFLCLFGAKYKNVINDKKNCWKNSSDQKDESTEEKIQTYAIIFQTDQDIKLIMIKMGIICIQKQKKRASK